MDKNQGINKSSNFPNPKYQIGTFSSNGYFKIDNQSLTTLFQGEVKYLNLTNYHFLRAINLFRFIKHENIKSMVSQSVGLS